MIKVIYIFGSISLMMLSACEGDGMNNKTTFGEIDNSIPQDVIGKISSKKIYFGHQSVGINILDGVNDLMKENNNIKLNIIKSIDPSIFDGPVFAHSQIGENSDPESKMEDFKKAIKNGIGNSADIAFMKFCYLDINKTIDLNKIFSLYKETMEELKKQYPNTKFVHVTVPLTLTEYNFRSFVKRILGKPDNNIMRYKYNIMLLNEYSGKDPVFDLAKIESTYPNGDKLTYSGGGVVYTSLIPEYAADNGHLNEIGRKIAAKELIKFLSGL